MTTEGTRLTVLVASRELLRAWSEHAARAKAVVAVDDADLPGVIETVRLRRPDEVVLEEALANSPRGGTLMTTLRLQHRVRGMTIRLLSPERVSALTSSHPGHTNPHIWLTAFAHPLPPRPRQRAGRIPLGGGEQALIDGDPARLLDLSPLGAQVWSERVLRPNQQVRIVLFPADGRCAVTATIVWSVFEPSPEPCYRAGVSFAQPVPTDVQTYVAQCGARQRSA
jgi:hypothetical protein